MLNSRKERKERKEEKKISTADYRRCTQIKAASAF
jgi:hypothetical protein